MYPSTSLPPRPKVKVYLPLAGIGLFVLLYIIATIFYPGGSDMDKTSRGFSWLHNYWCELLNTHAQNGEINTARPVAVSAMALLIVTLGYIWYDVPRYLPLPAFIQKLAAVCGIISMLVVIFLSPENHDLVINTAAASGVIAILLIAAGLYRKKSRLLFALALACLSLCLINTWMYYNGQRYHLPVVQKFTFACFLLWFALLRWNVYQFVSLK